MVKSMGPNSWSEECCQIATNKLDVSLIKTRVGGPHGRLEIEPRDYHTVGLMNSNFVYVLCVWTCENVHAFIKTVWCVWRCSWMSILHGRLEKLECPLNHMVGMWCFFWLLLCACACVHVDMPQGRLESVLWSDEPCRIAIIHICMHTYIHTCVHTYIHTDHFVRWRHWHHTHVFHMERNRPCTSSIRPCEESDCLVGG
jgi:hypothetical protein